MGSSSSAILPLSRHCMRTPPPLRSHSPALPRSLASFPLLRGWLCVGPGVLVFPFVSSLPCLPTVSLSQEPPPLSSCHVSALGIMDYAPLSPPPLLLTPSTSSIRHINGHPWLHRTSTFSIHVLWRLVLLPLMVCPTLLLIFPFVPSPPEPRLGNASNKHLDSLP